MAVPTSPVESSKNTTAGVSKAALLLILLTAVAYHNNNQSMDARVSTKGNRSHSSKYIPSRLESKMMKVSRSVLQYDKDWAPVCGMFRNESDIFYEDYHKYVATLERFAQATNQFRMDEGVEDIRRLSNSNRNRICKTMDKVLHGTFNAKADLSLTDAGYVEPLLPPMRHPRFCERGKKKEYKLDLRYLVHDFGSMCRELTPGTKTVFFDMGASLEFHGGDINPALNLVTLYNRFGIKFDHYYAFEYTVIPPATVYERVPEDLLPAYHWYNVPVESSPVSKQNPWKSLLSKFKPEDLVVIKLDIDTASIEVPLFKELAQDKYAALVDHVYFEHHVTMQELQMSWRRTAKGTMQNSLDLFTSLRVAGIGAHSWV